MTNFSKNNKLEFETVLSECQPLHEDRQGLENSLRR